MLKGMKLKAYPNQEQKHALFCMFGNQRFVWNQMLNMLNERYENNKKSIFPSSYELDELQDWDGSYSEIPFPIEFCPKCGRKLK